MKEYAKILLGVSAKSFKLLLEFLSITDCKLG